MLRLGSEIKLDEVNILGFVLNTIGRVHVIILRKTKVFNLDSL